MNDLLFGLVATLLTNIITYLSGFLNLQKTYVAMILVLIAGAVYRSVITYFQASRQEFLICISAIYSCSQVIYVIVKKNGWLDKIGF